MVLRRASSGAGRPGIPRSATSRASEVTTLTGPGELIDVVVTERGIAINPRRTDLVDATRDSDLPIRPIEELQAEIESICGGKPRRPKLTDQPVAAIKWVDGTVIDTAWRVG